MNRVEWLRGEVGKWQAEGLVSESVAGQLLERYETAGKTRLTAAVMVGAIGAVLLALGVIALLAANWSGFGRTARMIAGVAPLVVCGTVATIGAARGWGSRGFWEPVGVLWAGAACTALIIVAQTFQLSQDWPMLVLACAAVTLPVAWLTGSALVTAAWPGLLAFGVCAHWENSVAVVALWPLWLLVTPAFRRAWRLQSASGWRLVMDLGLGAALLAGSIAVPPILADALSWAQVPTFACTYAVMAGFAVMVALGVACALPGTAWLGLLAILAMGLMTPYEDAMDALLFSHTAGNTLEMWLVIGLGSLLMLAAAGLAIWAVRCRGRRPMLWAVVAPLFCVIVCFGLLPWKLRTPALASLAGLAVLVAYGVGTLREGVRRRSILLLNAGALVVLYAIVGKFLADDVSFTAKGIVMTLLGCAVLAGNGWWLRKHRTAATPPPPAPGKEVLP